MAQKISEEKARGNHSSGAVEIALSSLESDNVSLPQQLQSIFSEIGVAGLSLGKIKKDYVLVGRIELNGEKLADPSFIPEFKEGDLLKLSKKQSVKFI